MDSSNYIVVYIYNMVPNECHKPGLVSGRDAASAMQVAPSSRAQGGCQEPQMLTDISITVSSLGANSHVAIYTWNILKIFKDIIMGSKL
jgi:hypothetical protein